LDFNFPIISYKAPFWANFQFLGGLQDMSQSVFLEILAEFAVFGHLIIRPFELRPSKIRGKDAKGRISNGRRKKAETKNRI
jgi:hypothetical protein